MNTGLFVTVDGPHGVGKSTVAAEVAEQLTSYGWEVLVTAEPTDSLLGRIARATKQTLPPVPYTCLVAADRYNHIETAVVPALEAGLTVLCARYVESSLVLQRISGADIGFIWQVNKQVLVPHLSVILVADKDVLESRLRNRDGLSYCRRASSLTSQIDYYLDAGSFLRRQGFNVMVLDNGAASPKDTARSIVGSLIRLRQ